MNNNNIWLLRQAFKKYLPKINLNKKAVAIGPHQDGRIHLYVPRNYTNVNDIRLNVFSQLFNILNQAGISYEFIPVNKYYFLLIDDKDAEFLASYLTIGVN